MRKDCEPVLVLVRASLHHAVRSGEELEVSQSAGDPAGG